MRTRTSILLFTVCLPFLAACNGGKKLITLDTKNLDPRLNRNTFGVNLRMKLVADPWEKKKADDKRKAEIAARLNKPPTVEVERKVDEQEKVIEKKSKEPAGEQRKQENQLPPSMRLDEGPRDEPQLQKNLINGIGANLGDLRMQPEFNPGEEVFRPEGRFIKGDGKDPFKSFILKPKGQEEEEKGPLFGPEKKEEEEKSIFEAENKAPVFVPKKKVRHLIVLQGLGCRQCTNELDPFFFSKLIVK